MLIVVFPGMSQDDEEKPSFWQRTYFGGSFSLQFGSFTYIDVSPMMGYGFTDRFSAGLGITYRYVKDNYWNYDYNVYGGRLFTRYGIFENVFLHGEYEFLNWQNVYSLEREWTNAAFIGGGYSTHLGAQKGAQIYILYNLAYDQFSSPYNEPYVIRFSITF